MTGLNPEERMFRQTWNPNVKRVRGVVDGFLTTAGVTEENVHDLQSRLTVRTDDVFVATYPKCGTTWMQQIVKLIWNEGVDDGRDVDVALPWIEQMTMEEIEPMPSPRGFKTHLLCHMVPGGLPASTRAKYIYVYRNPKDVAVSSYYQCKAMFADASWEKHFDDFITGNVGYGNIMDHILSWWKYKDSPNVLFLSYEGMKKNPYNSIVAVAKHLGYSISEEVLQRIVVQTNFSNMKTNDKANKTWRTMYCNTQSSPFMRKGAIGDWRNHFTDQQSLRMDRMISEKLGDVSINFEFD